MSHVDKIDILAIDRKICNGLQGEDLYFHYCDTSLLINKYEDLLEKGEPTRGVVIEYLKEIGRPLPNLCIGCEEDLLEPYEVCEGCGCSQGKVFLRESFSKGGHVGSPKSDYSRLENFRKVIDRFQGRQNVEIPREVYDGLESHFQHQEVRADQMDVTDVTKRDIREALKKLGFSKYYGDVHLIHREFTGAASNDIRQYEDGIIYDFDRVVREFRGRNFFNTQYVLFALLTRRGYQCSRSEFFIPKSCKGEAFDELCNTHLETLCPSQFDISLTPNVI